MTAKRYHKLCRAEMTKLMRNSKGAGICIRAAAASNPFKLGVYTSYAAAWAALRVAFTYGDNTPPIR